jgi:hypothetical protein
MTPLCDGERHYHDVTLYAGLPVGMAMAAACACGSASLMVAHDQDTWTVSLLDGTSVLGPVVRDSLVPVVDTELVVGIRRPLSEG